MPVSERWLVGCALGVAGGVWLWRVCARSGSSPAPLAEAVAAARWDVIVVTAATQGVADAVCEGLRTSPAASGAALLGVADPSSAVRVGSGAATLNAIVAVAEELSARAGYGTLSAEPLGSARVLVLHAGPCGRGASAHPCLSNALLTLPVADAPWAAGAQNDATADAVSVSSGAVSVTSGSVSVSSNAGVSDVSIAAHATLVAVTKLFCHSPPGFAIASTDSLLWLHPHVAPQHRDANAHTAAEVNAAAHGQTDCLHPPVGCVHTSEHRLHTSLHCVHTAFGATPDVPHSWVRPDPTNAGDQPNPPPVFYLGRALSRRICPSSILSRFGAGPSGSGREASATLAAGTVLAAMEPRGDASRHSSCAAAVAPPPPRDIWNGAIKGLVHRVGFFARMGSGRARVLRGRGLGGGWDEQPSDTAGEGTVDLRCRFIPSRSPKGTALQGAGGTGGRGQWAGETEEGLQGPGDTGGWRDRTAPVYTGIVWLRAATAQALFTAATSPPLHACTQLGEDAGVPPIGIGLRADVLAPLLYRATRQGYVDAAVGPGHREARVALWAALRGDGGVNGAGVNETGVNEAEAQASALARAGGTPGASDGTVALSSGASSGGADGADFTPTAADSLALRLALAPAEACRYSCLGGAAAWRDALHHAASEVSPHATWGPPDSVHTGSLHTGWLLSHQSDDDAVSTLPPRTAVVRSRLGRRNTVGEGAAVEYCWLGDGVRVGSGCLLSGVTAAPGGVSFPPGIAVFQVALIPKGGQPGGAALQSPPPGTARGASVNGASVNSDFDLGGGGSGDCDLVFLAHSLSDDLHAPAGAAGATCLGIPWDELLRLVGGPEAVWAEGEARTLWNARLFPVHTPEALRQCEERGGGASGGGVDGGGVNGGNVSGAGLSGGGVSGGGVNGGAVNGGGVNGGAAVNGGAGAWLAPDAWSLFGWLLEGAPPPPGWACAPRVSMSGAAARAAVGRMLRARRDLAVEIDLAELCARIRARRVGGSGEGGMGGIRAAGGARRGDGGGGGGGDRGGGTVLAATALPVLPLLRHLARGSLPTFSRLLSALDTAARDSSSTQDAAHTLAALAEAFSLRAAGHGGPRAGAAANTGWGAPLGLLRSGRVADAVRALAGVRGSLISGDQPRSLIRAARHYDAGVSICIALCVRTCAVHLPPPSLPLPVCAWAVAEAAARVDLAGGWTDTPPLCFEAGGCARAA